MRTQLAQGFFLTILFSFSSHALQATLTLDPNHSYMATQSAKSPVYGTISVEKDNRIHAAFSMIKQLTGIPDNSSKEPLFDSLNYPETSFKAEKIDFIDNDNAKIRGLLCLHGMTRPVVFDVNIKKLTNRNSEKDEVNVSFKAYTKIKRSDFGVVTALPDVGDEVTVEFSGEASNQLLRKLAF